MNSGDIIQKRYRVDQVIGQGSMGITYKALDLRTKRPVAVKVLHFSRVQEWKAVEMFEREANVLQQLHHPRIPAYIDYFTAETQANVQFLLVQEYIEGKTLQQLVEKGWRGTETEILDIFGQLVNILAYLHTLRPPVIHRDINPKNILLSSLNEVYLVDFGAVQERIRTTFLGGSTIVGTYGYVPFEQFSGQTVPASDYYAVGATLLFMLTHRHPSDFPTEEMKPKFRNVIQASPHVVKLLDGLLEPAANKRIATPDAVRALLDGLPHVPFTGQTSARQSKVAKPAWTKIEKIVTKQPGVTFRIPKKMMRFLPGQATLELTPEQIRFRDAYTLGKTVGLGWHAPTAGLRPWDITWHVEGEKPVLGLNYHGQTFEVRCVLALAEVEWLAQELRDYLADRYLAALPEADRRMLAQRTDSPLLALNPPAKPVGTVIESHPKGEQQRTLRIPRRVVDPGFSIRSRFGKQIIEILTHLLGTRVIDMSPTWIQVSHSYFGIRLGRIYHVPTAAIRPGDINWYFKRMETGHLETATRSLVLGINYAGRTLELGSHLTQAEAEWLLHEIGQYILTHAKPSPDGQIAPEFEMK